MSANGGTVTLGELMPERGESVDPANHPDEVFDLYSIPAFDRREPEVLRGAEIGSTKQLVEPGDVMISKIVPHIRRAWVVGENRGHRMIASSEWIVFRDKRIDAGFMRHQLVEDRFHAKFMSTVSGVGGSLLRARPAHVAKIQISLPPLAEQRRIAKVLDRTETLRAKRRAVLAQLDILTQSLFLDLFGDPVANPKGWPNPTLGGLLTFQQYGPRFFNETYSTDGIRIVRITDLDEAGNLDFAAMPRMTVSDADRDKYSLQPGDVIFARTGATVGKVALIQPEDPPCIAGAYFITMRFEKTLDPLYARAVLVAPSVRAIVAKRSRQAAQQNFSGPGLRQLPMPLPPISLQREFARRVSAVETLKTAQRASLVELDALFASLQHRAFHGEL